MKKTYILIDPNDDTGNDDGIIDQQDLTEHEAYLLNNERFEQKSDRRWILKFPSKSLGITHID